MMEGRSSMETSKPGASRYYRPELDVVRFLAFLLVFLHHTLPHADDPRINHIVKGLAPFFYALAGACQFGLSLFFTLSAFLICELLLRERESTGTVGIKQFYIRRILRIWPLYYFGLALGVAVALLPGGHTADLARIGWFVIFMGAWHSALNGLVGNPVSPLWSISVEEQFYMFAPWTIRYLNRRSLYGFCALLVLVADSRLYHLGRVAVIYIRVWADSLVQFECFAAGILLCLVLHGSVPRIAIWQRLILTFGCCFCWVGACYELHPFFYRASDNPGSWPLIGIYAMGALGSVFLLVAFLGMDSNLLPGWTIYLGRISFGLYVYHGFALYMTNHLLASFKSPVYFLKSALALGLTILMAALSYRYLETPFLKMKKRHAVIESQPIAGGG
jgi:peptidoglycan/LPS O-acetylase OafA/YrhL